jgi:hypothetical protein
MHRRPSLNDRFCRGQSAARRATMWQAMARVESGKPRRATDGDPKQAPVAWPRPGGEPTLIRSSA